MLPQLVDNYNNSIHTATLKTPNQLFHGDEDLINQTAQHLFDNKPFVRVPPKFKVGDRVRVAVKELVENRRNALKKHAYTFTPLVFSVSTVIARYQSVPRYQVDGIEESFTGWDLLYVNEAQMIKFVAPVMPAPVVQQVAPIPPLANMNVYDRQVLERILPVRERRESKPTEKFVTNVALQRGSKKPSFPPPTQAVQELSYDEQVLKKILPVHEKRNRTLSTKALSNFANK